MFFWSPLQCEKELEQIIARTPFVMHLGTFRVQRILGTFRVQRILINDANSYSLSSFRIKTLF